GPKAIGRDGGGHRPELGGHALGPGGAASSGALSKQQCYGNHGRGRGGCASGGAFQGGWDPGGPRFGNLFFPCPGPWGKTSHEQSPASGGGAGWEYRSASGEGAGPGR